MQGILCGYGRKRALVLVLLLILTGVTCLFSIEFYFDAPVFTGPDPDATYQLNSDMARWFREAEDDFRRNFEGINANPVKLIGAFANSSVFSSAGATQRSYLGYKTFAVSFGVMAGVQLPASPFSIVNEIENISDRMEKEGDIKLGVDPQLINAQIGLNTSKFFLKDLYLGLKFGFMRLNIEGIQFGTFSVGLLGNYQLVNQKSFARGLFLWRGLNIGTGFIYQNTNLSFNLAEDTIIESFDFGYGYTTVAMTPKLFFDFTTNTYTIPLEVMSSIRLLWFLNIPFGLGADFAFGDSNLSVGGKVDFDIIRLPSGWSLSREPRMSVTMGGKQTPTIANPKLMTGLGLSFGPVILDIPLTYYFLDNGYNIGLTIGIVF